MQTQARLLRNILNLSQTEMADFMGMPVATWRSWESGAREPSGAGKRFMEFIQMINMLNPAIIDAMKPGTKTK